MVPIRSTQHMADLIKGVVLDADDVSIERRLEALRAVSRFERCGWHPGMMSQAIEEAGAGMTVTASSVEISGANRLDTLEAVMSRYLDIFGFEDQPVLFTMAEAAEYLGISQSMMETYVIRRGEIQGSRIGRSWVFTREALDRFQSEQRRSPGRPPAKEG
jgi:excisionase family DNA binding protein